MKHIIYTTITTILFIAPLTSSANWPEWVGEARWLDGAMPQVQTTTLDTQEMIKDNYQTTSMEDLWNAYTQSYNDRRYTDGYRETSQYLRPVPDVAVVPTSNMNDGYTTVETPSGTFGIKAVGLKSGKPVKVTITQSNTAVPFRQVQTHDSDWPSWLGKPNR